MIADETPPPGARAGPAPGRPDRGRVGRARGGGWARGSGWVLGAAALAALGGCAGRAAVVRAAPPPTVARQAPAAAQQGPDGLYSGGAVLLETRGDCNAGGTGRLLVADGRVHFRDDRNGRLDGPLGPDGRIDLRAGRTRLSGELRDGTFDGTIAGGTCDYRLAFRREAPAPAVEVAAFAPSRPDPAGVALGMAAFDARRPGRAVEGWRAAALNGDPTAALYLGAMYDTGQGVAQDQAQALAWYRRAAEGGNVTGMFDVGVMFDAGRGVARDPAEAARWYAMAAERGYGRAEYDLALLYRDGSGVPRDPVRARRLFLRAARHGISAARDEVPAAETGREAGS